MTQEFTRTALCFNTTVLWLDDYLGNEQATVWGTTELAQVLEVVSQYYGVAYASYSAMVRDLVYRDTRETQLSPDWYKHGRYERQIHPGASVHQALAWVVAYQFLSWAVEACAVAPEPRSLELPPRLTPSLTIDQVSDLWKEPQCRRQRCPFVWTAALDRQHNDPDWIRQNVDPHVTTKHWEIAAQHPKRGYIAKGHSDNEWVLSAQSVSRMEVFYMQSYGPQWRDSRAKVTVTNSVGIVLNSTEVSGYHSKDTSETESAELTWNETTDVTVRITMSGQIFKLQGVVLCGD